jgi:hypothetical protein
MVDGWPPFVLLSSPRQRVPPSLRTLQGWGPRTHKVSGFRNRGPCCPPFRTQPRKDGATHSRNDIQQRTALERWATPPPSGDRTSHRRSVCPDGIAFATRLWCTSRERISTYVGIESRRHPHGPRGTSAERRLEPKQPSQNRRHEWLEAYCLGRTPLGYRREYTAFLIGRTQRSLDVAASPCAVDCAAFHVCAAPSPVL